MKLWEYRSWSHTQVRLECHIVRCTKYRYKVLTWDIKLRCRELIKQICDAQDIQIIKWVVSYDHIHILIEYPAKLSISDIVKRLKWRTSRIIQDEFPKLKDRYRWCHFRSIWYFAASTWTMTDELIQQYLEHHNNPNEHTWATDKTFILEWD